MHPSAAAYKNDDFESVYQLLVATAWRGRVRSICELCRFLFNKFDMWRSAHLRFFPGENECRQKRTLADREKVSEKGRGRKMDFEYNSDGLCGTQCVHILARIPHSHSLGKS